MIFLFLAPLRRGSAGGMVARSDRVSESLRKDTDKPGFPEALCDTYSPAAGFVVGRKPKRAKPHFGDFALSCSLPFFRTNYSALRVKRLKAVTVKSLSYDFR